jgi:hypothetical protein
MRSATMETPSAVFVGSYKVGGEVSDSVLPGA